MPAVLTGRKSWVETDEFNASAWHHVWVPGRGIIVNAPPTLLPKEATPRMVGMLIKDGIPQSDFGHSDYPVTSDTKSNELNGSVMRMDQFYELSGLSYLLAMTTKSLYQYNTSTNTWDCIAKGTLIDDAESAWTASTDVTSTADASVKMRGTNSAKHVIAADFTTGIVSYEDKSSTDVSTAANKSIAFWIRASAAVANDVLRLRVSEQTGGGTGASYADFTVPALTADTWKHVIIDGADKVTGSGTFPDDFDAVLSVALVAQSDPGAITVYLDDIRTVFPFTGDEDNRFSVATMTDAFYITNGVDQPQRVTASDGILSVADATTTLAGGSITTSEIVFSFKDHIFYMNNTENEADAPQRVTWSNIGNGQDFTEGTQGYQDLVDDESWVMAAEILSANLVAIYKERSIVLMTWVGGHTPFRFVTAIHGTGLLAKEAITNVGGAHIAVGPDVIYEYNGGSTIDILDDPVKNDLYSVMDKTNSDRIFLAYIEEDDELQVWIPTGTAYPDDVWCYNVVTENWYRKTRTMTGFGYYQRQSSFTIGDLVGNIGDQNWRFGDALTKADSPITLVGDQNGKVYELDKNTLNNDGTAISNEFETPDFTLPDTPHYQNFFMRVPILLFEAKGQSITTHYSTDGGSTWSPTQGAAGNVTSLTSVYDIYQQDFDVVVRKIRFRFMNDTAGSGFYLRYYGFKWLLRSSR